MKIDFEKENGLVPAIVQDAASGKVLMLGYMNQEAYNKTIEEKVVTFFSRSKQRLWTKGETSGNKLQVVEIKSDCDSDALLIKAIPKGPTCHTGADTCWGETNEDSLAFLRKLEMVIAERKSGNDESSYTASLFRKGINKIAQKVGEEAVEVVIEAKDSNDELFLSESADLLFHYLILLQAKGFTLSDVTAVLASRHK
ncbi:MAG TPA: bifunctional phosphoribosyl-AMP cyclohydrolase/phosphoribosyl-ATP diphosphatase HisIE [Flavobacteriales bacterium]|nr:bifunctional phosphoribosyl-AMP cyclohydrolase/phosphoribosyl-ATP diphosphatase HisIE [Flavobacteriales bacterium]HRE95888.1 bifunctional phosphoribosyl-AMP cyclohydrolase/phosphoribosyl-ATP diphosphatase HisIE [Flavobacteriales bacterium]HRJ35825.1 bifunctional phosphoribosyl-AMP cyclohydrolase/phosphoribosyl-ATP diphosphatase HisIE [Flavobacteriales bacterium]HRJ38294.1 bifunctional phosphoribosyl-AMP cyclohydrolase/phosphoribosyl-ATP diphosphatase HisIE [Flavobacteriales bacterium]